ncbi:MAG: hypothetical protein N838_35130 [Thiohalocapsa sp. PB-PSB1]|nr:MAG: hypothetical protein N838_35130 [Thiohalocapsa sp. PB-PSB1]
MFEGNRVDTQTLLPQVKRIQAEFGITRLAIVGDRGMLSQTRIDELKETPGVDPSVDWLTALKSSAIRRLVVDDRLQMDLFDERSHFELVHPDYPGERLVACRNPSLAEHRANKREALLQATTQELEAVAALIERGKLRGREQITRRVERLIASGGLTEQVSLEIGEALFTYRLDDPERAAAALLHAFDKHLEQVRKRLKRGCGRLPNNTNSTAMCCSTSVRLDSAITSATSRRHLQRPSTDSVKRSNVSASLSSRASTAAATRSACASAK